MPRVSVIMVFHRVTPFLLPAVQSVLDQTHRDLELLLVDNGTGAGLDPLATAGHDPRIRLLALPENRGIACGHNLAVSRATGEHIVLLDHDDIALPTRIERQGAFLRDHPEVGLVSCAADTVDARGRIVGREFSLGAAHEQKAYTQFAAPVVMPAYTGRREVFVRFPYRTEIEWTPDFDFLARAAESYTLCGLPEVLLQYRRHPEQTTVRHSAAQIAGQCLVRVLTARRRAGREEQFDALTTEFRSWRETPPPLPELFATIAGRCLQEGFAALAVFHARRLLAARRSPQACVRAANLLGRALRAEPRQAGLLLRLFFTGPVRAHGFKPA